MVGEIEQAFPKLPPNVFVIPPESKVSTYAAMMQCDAVIIYGTKTGVELTSFGMPVDRRRRGLDPQQGPDHSTSHRPSTTSRSSIGCRWASAWPPRADRARARKYAYHFFFRRMIPIEALGPAPAGRNCPYQVAIQGLDDLRPGRNLGLDTICRGIMERSDFIYPAELVDVPAKAAASASG